MTNLRQFGYNPENTQASAGYDALPAGDYPAIAVNAEVKQTKDQTGSFLSVEFDIFEGHAKGRKVFANYNLVNKSQKATEIGHAQLKQFSESVNKPNAENVSDLLNIPLILTLSITESPEYGKQNQVKSHKPYNAAQAYNPHPAQQTTQPNGGASSTPNWAKTS